jgi:hypothetical protein
LLAHEAVGLGELAAYRLASVHIPTALMRALSTRLNLDPQTMPELSLQSGNLTLLRDVVLGTDAVLLAAERPFQVEIAQGLLKRVPVREFLRDEQGAALSADLALIHLAGRTPTPAGQLLMGMIREEARQLLSQSPRSKQRRRSLKAGT